MMQVTVIQAPTPPTPPAAPSLPSRGGPMIVTPRELAPMTAQDVAVLQARRSELSTQLRSADGRRRELQQQLTKATGQDRAGLEQRIGVLDARLSGLESDFADVGRQLSSASAAIATTRQPSSLRFGPPTRSRLADNFMPITIVFTLFVLSPLALAISRGLWKRGSISRPLSSPADAQRLERMEQAMEAIAIEIERVSEGQRFVTRLLSEGRISVPVGAGQLVKEAVRVPAK